MAFFVLGLFFLSLLVLLKSSGYATRYSSELAKALGVSEFFISFFIIAMISVFPEGAVSIISALNGVPEFGLGTLLGSNVADLTLVFGIAALFSANGIAVKSELLRRDFLYLLLLLFPIFLGFDGSFSRVDGIVLVLAGLFFFYTVSGQGKEKKKLRLLQNANIPKNVFLLLLSLAVLTASAFFTVQFGVDFASQINVPPLLVGLIVVSVGTCIPELFFSIKSVKSHHDELALGDILGIVITDATIIIGAMALINPFSFSPRVIQVTGIAMLLAALLVLFFIRTERVLTKKGGLLLLLFYALFILMELAVNGLLL